MLPTPTSISPQATSRPHGFLTEWLLLIGGLLVLGTFVIFSLVSQRESREIRERERLAAQTRIIGDIVVRQLDSINRALVSVRDELPLWRGQADGLVFANRRLKAFADAMPGVRTMIVMDAEGTVLAANRPELIGQNFRQRDYFLLPQSQPNSDTLYVAPPFRTVLGVWTMNLVRMVADSQGRFAGIVLAALDPEEFSIVLGSVLYAPDMWSSIAHGDGRQFLLLPESAGRVDMIFAQPGSFYARHRESGEVATVMTGTVQLSGEDQVVALRTVQPPELRMNKPLVVAVGRDMDAFFASWRRDARIYAGFYLLLASICVPSLFIVQRRRRIADREIKSAVDALRESRERLSIAADSASIGVWDLDLASKRLLWDDWMHRIYGIAPEDFPGTVEAWRQRVHPEDLDRVMKEINLTVKSGEIFDDKFKIIRPDGTIRHIKASAKIFFGPNGRPARMTGVNFDITESSLNAQALATLNTQLSAQSEQLRSLAFVDGLTGVANRRHFDENLHAEWRRSRRDRVPLAMLMIDIDHFKLYNDQYGHQAGDVCLQAVARVLKESFGRSHDMVARYGGEEFACLLPASGMDGALAKAEELRAAVENLHIGHKSSPVAPVVTISVGVAAIVPDAEAHPDQLLAAADTALYAAKRDGRNRVCRSA